MIFGLILGRISIRPFFMNMHPYINSFAKLLEEVNVDNVSNEAYCRDYLQHLIDHKSYYLKIYADLLKDCLDKTMHNNSDIQLVDFGCGNGLLGLFAVHCGFKNVLLIDIDHKFVQAAKNLASILNLQASFLQGSYNDLKNIKPDILLGVDVFEHVYNAEGFLYKIRSLNSNVVMGFITASNPWNKHIVKQLKQLQWQDEHIGNSTGGLLGNLHPPYKEIRREIIAGYNVKHEDQLVEATRGLCGDDLENAINIYLKSHRLPIPPHGNNTCHPVSGSWTERLYTPEELHSLFFCDGYNYEIQSGFYNSTGTSVKSFLKGVLNLLILIFGKKIAPWIKILHFKN